jgi:membrane protease YdiL (CAAX protease family)
MLRLLRAASEPAELIVVIAGVFLPLTVMSTLGLLGVLHGPAITHRGMIGLLVHETLVTAIFGSFLAVRGWTRHRVGLTAPRPMDLLQAVGLILLVLMASWSLWLVFSGLAPSAAVSVAQTARGLVAPSLGIGTVLAVSCVNALFEELFLCGYLITALRRRYGEWPAVAASAGIRLSYHFYQGVASLFGLVPVGLAFGIVFARRGRLWPLVVAHALFDMLALLPYA